MGRHNPTREAKGLPLHALTLLGLPKATLTRLGPPRGHLDLPRAAKELPLHAEGCFDLLRSRIYLSRAAMGPPDPS